MNDIIVRYATKEDLPAVNVIRQQVNEVHINGRPDIFRADGWPYIEAMVFKRFDEHEHSGILVAVMDDEIIGFAIVQYITKPESPYGRERRYYHIEEFGVDEKHRRQGAATAMITFARADAKERGFDKMELDMWEFNTGALAFYESIGFKTYRRYMESNLD